MAEWFDIVAQKLAGEGYDAGFAAVLDFAAKQLEGTTETEQHVR